MDFLECAGFLIRATYPRNQQKPTPLRAKNTNYWETGATVALQRLSCHSAEHPHGNTPWSCWAVISEEPFKREILVDKFTIVFWNADPLQRFSSVKSVVLQWMTTNHESRV